MVGGLGLRAALLLAIAFTSAACDAEPAAPRRVVDTLALEAALPAQPGRPFTRASDAGRSGGGLLGFDGVDMAAGDDSPDHPRASSDDVGAGLARMQHACFNQVLHRQILARAEGDGSQVVLPGFFFRGEQVEGLLIFSTHGQGKARYWTVTYPLDGRTDRPLVPNALATWEFGAVRFPATHPTPGLETGTLFFLDSDGVVFCAPSLPTAQRLAQEGLRARVQRAAPHSSAFSPRSTP